MLNLLSALFEGKEIRITHVNDLNPMKDAHGFCVKVHATPGTSGSFDVELKDGSRYGFSPDIITDTYADGPLKALAGGRRKIETI